ncbi:acyl carrier protein [Ulvibacter litoralis]|uniref:Acyl carrier protein n=1 Tax=Ulvibacter litoralis TaxID=227084 RepID=A0A1G7JS50_9FLAO|nr:acyl carrier protein [Ulvibacter litoralis]GHC65896.1 hypothetical protein GCM10008083_33800 [Ulvibacter litoralis]SDF27644.1 hypothetical protein SAMN05421855_1264 [Ulvibacter litoralis]
MKEFELKNTDPEDIEDLLVKVEKSFGIEFSENELVNVRTFGELCDYIKNKIQLDKQDDCTSQQAFYKLRNVLTSILKVDKNEITPDTQLADLLPRQIRKTRINQIEQSLGFKLSLLRPPHFVTTFLLLLLLGSIISLFFSWQLGLGGMGLSIGGLWLAFKIGNELDLKTVGQVAEKMTRENYLKSRRNPKTFNEKEIERVLIDWFSNDLLIDKSKLTREARLT